MYRYRSYYETMEPEMIRVYINGVSFYTTLKRVKDGTVSDQISINTAVSVAYSRMQNRYRSVSTTVTVYDNGMNRKVYNVQISKE
jgi:hypothetical protein